MFQVWAEGFAATLSEAFQIVPGEPAPAVEMTMTRGGTVRGRIVDPVGNPIEGVEIRTQRRGAVLVINLDDVVARRLRVA